MTDEDEPHPDDPVDASLQRTVDAANVGEFKRRGRKRKIDARRNDEFWSSALTTQQGRRALWELLAEAHTFETLFGCGPNGFPQPERSWMLAGEQAFGHRLYLTWLRIAPVQVNLMLQENDVRLAAPLSAKRKGD